MNLKKEVTLDQRILQAAKNVAIAEQKAFEAEVMYQEAFDNFKLAQQKFHDLQREWIKENETANA